MSDSPLQMPTLSELESLPKTRKQLEAWGIAWPPRRGWLKKLKRDAISRESFGASPTKSITIEFDGGTSCNIPRLGLGIGYGSYQISDQEIRRVEFGRGHSCNSAEIWTLISALKDLSDQMPPHMLCVVIRGDSKIALKWANPRYRKEPKMTSTENFRNAIVELRKIASRFGDVKTEWRARAHSVMLFGH